MDFEKFLFHIFNRKKIEFILKIDNLEKSNFHYIKSINLLIYSFEN